MNRWPQLTLTRRMTVSPNRTGRGYVSCLTTQAPWERILSLMKKPVAAVAAEQDLPVSKKGAGHGRRTVITVFGH